MPGQGRVRGGAARGARRLEYIDDVDAQGLGEVGCVDEAAHVGEAVRPLELELQDEVHRLLARQVRVDLLPFGRLRIAFLRRGKDDVGAATAPGGHGGLLSSSISSIRVQELFDVVELRASRFGGDVSRLGGGVSHLGGGVLDLPGSVPHPI